MNTGVPIQPPTESVQAHLQEIDNWGYTRVPGYLSADTVQQLLELTEQEYNKQELPLRPDRSGTLIEEKILLSLQNRDKRFIDLLDEPFLTSILMERLNDPFYRALPPDAPNYILGFYNARSSGAALALHTDTFMPTAGNRTWTFQVAFQLERSTEQNGAFTVVPGSHKSGQFVDHSVKPVAVCAEAGDLILWDSRLWHGALANTSGESRWALIATFSCWWVKQRTDIPRTLPQSIYQQLNARQKALLGFCSIPPAEPQDWFKQRRGYQDLLPNVRDWLGNRG